MATGKDDAVYVAAAALAEQLESAGVEVCYDDRPKVSPGVKFKDAELLGAPFIAVVGRGLAEGMIEVKIRATGDSEQVPVADAPRRLADLVAEALAR